MSQYRTLRDAVWAIEGISQPALVVALRLVEHWPRIMPSVAGLAQFTKMSERNVRYALKELEERGVIAIQHVSGRRSVYQFIGVSIPHLGTPADSAPLHHVHPTPADSAPPTPAPRAPEADKILKQTREAGARKTRRAPEWYPERLPSVLELEKLVPNLDFEWGQFCDHHDKEASAFADWNAAWRTWLRNAARFSARAKGTRWPVRREEDDAGYA